MSLLDKASLVVTPNAYKTSKLYSVVPSDGSGDMTVTRATTATRVNSAGLIESVANNIPRLDYLNSSCPSLLVEPQRTNLCPTSSNFGVTLFNVTVSRNVVTAPNGNNEADRLLDNNANDEHLLSQNYSSITNGTTYTYSCFFKSDGTGGRAVIRTYVGNWVYAVYNLNNGTVAFTDGSLTASIQNFGNGWYRCILTTTAVMDYTPMVTQIGVANSSNQYVYQGTSNLGLYFHGYQVEQGSYVTSYIPTTSTAITRNADVISKTGISSLIGQTEGAMYVDFDYTKNTSSSSIVSLINTSVSNSIFFETFNDILYLTIITGGSLVCQIPFIALTNQNYKIAVGYKLNDIVFYVNGVQIGVDTSATIPATNQIQLGFLTGSFVEQKTNIKSIALFKTRLTNSELQSLTTL
jgi:hypothetical protein